MVKYENAGIKSKAELAQRLINGEVFFHGLNGYYMVHFDPAYTVPFRYGSTELVKDGKPYSSSPNDPLSKDCGGDCLACVSAMEN